MRKVYDVLYEMSDFSGAEFDFKDLVSEVVGDGPTADGNDGIEDGVEVIDLEEEGKTGNSTCICTISPLVMAPSNTVSVDTDSLGTKPVFRFVLIS